ncbi:MAG: ATP-binding protein, partial [Myxococcales bacterium]
LALQVVARTLPSCPGGVWWCDLTDADDVAQLCDVVSRALGPATGADRRADDRVGELGRRLRALGRALLILDNAESIAGDAAAPVARWLSAAPDVRVLVTSRVRLRLTGESLVELGPLGLAQSARDAERAEAVRLLVERARAVRQDFALDAGNVADVTRLVRQLDGIPLAIELAATRMAVLSPAELLQRLPERLALLHGADAAGNLRTLRGAIDWSFAHLTPFEQEALTHCAVFRGGFTLGAVEAVVRVSGAGAPAVLDLLQRLRESSLLFTGRPEHFPGELRFGMYLSIRDYALEKLEASGASQATRRRAAHYYAALGRQYADLARGPDGVSALRRLDLEADNLLAAHRVLSAPDAPAEDAREALGICLALRPALLRHSVPTLLTLLDRALENPLPPDPELRARARIARAHAHVISGRPADGAAEAEAVLTLARQLGHRPLEAHALGELGYAQRRVGRLEDAERHLSGAIALARELGDRAALVR